MSPDHRLPAERRVDRLRPQKNIRLSRAQADELLSSGHYERHLGLGVGTSYRRARGNGCYHLRLRGRHACFHWDQWDPRRFRVRHFLETPALVVPAAIVSVLAVVGVVTWASGDKGA